MTEEDTFNKLCRTPITEMVSLVTEFNHNFYVLHDNAAYKHTISDFLRSHGWSPSEYERAWLEYFRNKNVNYGH